MHWLACLLVGVSAMPPAQSTSPGWPNETPLASLLGNLPAYWTPISPGAPIGPMAAEGMGSEPAAAWRSPSGSWLFLSFTSRSMERPPFSADEMEAVVTPEAFAALGPTALSITRENASLGSRRHLSYLRVSFNASRLGYRLEGSNLVAYRAALIPLALNHGGRLDSYLVSIDARFSTTSKSEIADFDRLLSQLDLSTAKLQIVRPEEVEIARLMTQSQPRPALSPPTLTSPPPEPPAPPKNVADELVDIVVSGGPQSDRLTAQADPRIRALVTAGQRRAARREGEEILAASLAAARRRSDADRVRFEVAALDVALSTGDTELALLTARSALNEKRFQVSGLEAADVARLVRAIQALDPGVRASLTNGPVGSLLALSSEDRLAVMKAIPARARITREARAGGDPQHFPAGTLVEGEDGRPACTTSGKVAKPVTNLLEVTCGR